MVFFVYFYFYLVNFNIFLSIMQIYLLNNNCDFGLFK